MVILIQLAIIGIIFSIRLYSLLGKGVRVSKHGNGQDQLENIGYNKGRLTNCQFGLKQRHGFPFIIRKERWYHRLLKSLGVATELRVGCDNMQREWFFITDYPAHLERALHSGVLREALRELLALPITRLSSTLHRLWCDFDCKVLKDKKETKDFPREEYWRKLNAVREGLRHLSDPSGRRFPMRWTAFIFLGLHLALFITALSGFAPTFIDRYEIIDKWQWLSHAAAYALPAVCLWFGVIIYFFHGTSWAGWVLADFVLTGIIGVMMTTGYFVREANILADMSPPQHIERTVSKRTCSLECRKSCGKNCTRRSSYKLDEKWCSPERRIATKYYYEQRDSICRASAKYQFTLYMPHWLPKMGKNRYSYHPRADVYDASPVGTTLRIPLREGALGIEWVDVDTIQPTAD